MAEFIIYALKTIFSLGVFALVYRYSLYQEVNFGIRRFYLLNAVFLSFLLPLLSFNFSVFNTQSNAIGSFILEEITIYSDGLRSIEGSSRIPFSEIFFYSYILISGFLAFRVLYQLVKIVLSIKKYPGDPTEKLVVYRIPLENVSFSFFRFVFIGKTSEKEDMEKILAHEEIHAGQWHTLDVLIMEILCIIFWFNPLVWWFRNEIKNVHEYLADDGALQRGFNRKSYQITLLEHLIGSASLTITNNFNYSLIKNRIAMMNKEKNNKKNTWKAFMLIPVTAVLIIGFACTERSETYDNTNKENLESMNPDEEVFFVVEDMPTFNGGPAEDFRKYIAENLRYPEMAKKEGIQGKVFVQFVVNSKGEVVDVKVARGIDKSLDEEAIRVTASSPNWEPGKQRGKAVNVAFTFPINFVLR